MKGVVYTELLEFVEHEMGLEMVDELCSLEGLSSGGVYTAVGTYADQDVRIMLGHLTKRSSIPVSELLHGFGKHLFKSLSSAYSDMLKEYSDTFSMVEALDSFIHPTVKKLYPDAQLPGFKTLERSTNNMIVLYQSKRGMHDLAHGLLEQCCAHFNEPMKISMKSLNEANTEVEITLQRLS